LELFKLLECGGGCIVIQEAIQGQGCEIMSVCVGCMKEFTKGKGNKRGFCSLQCWRAYEHETQSNNCLGVGRMNSKANWSIKNKDSNNLVKRNLGEILDEMDIYVRSPKERSKIFFNNDLSDSTIKKLNEVLLLCKKKKLEYGIV
jgi:hypothetical protein